MSMINGFKRRLVGWLGGEMAEAKTPPSPSRKPSLAASTEAGVEDTDLGRAIFDPAQPADAPFFDRDSAAYPNDRRLKQRRNARAQTRVLLIDDSPTIVALGAIKQLLPNWGYLFSTGSISGIILGFLGGSVFFGTI